MGEEKKIKVVLLEPGKLARTAEIGTSLESLQKVVDGLIEPFYPFEEQVCIVCNDEGKINCMMQNRSVKNEDGVMVDFICGPAFICDCRSESFDSLSDEQLARYTKMFRYPEHLANLLSMSVCAVFKTVLLLGFVAAVETKCFILLFFCSFLCNFFIFSFLRFWK